MAKHLGKTFTDQKVVLDGEAFERCTFTRCRLVYRGTGPAGLEGSTFDRCGYEFHGPAANTIHFLRALYCTGPQGRKLVAEVFDSIRQEPPSAGAGNGSPAD